MSETDQITYDGTIPSMNLVAAWLRERGGSCTSPAAVEFGFENAFRVATADGPHEMRRGDHLDYRDGQVHVTARTPR